MRVLIQQIRGGLFINPAGQWTARCEEAMDFRNATEALDVCLLNRLRGVQIVLKFYDPIFDLALPVTTIPRSEDRL